MSTNIKVMIINIAFVLSFFCFSWTVNANQIPELTLEYAEQLILDAHDIEYSIAGQFQWFEAGKHYRDVETTSLRPDTDSVISYGTVIEGINTSSVKQLIKNTFSKRLSKKILASDEFKLFESKFRYIDDQLYYAYVISMIGLDSYEHSVKPDGQFAIIKCADGKATLAIETITADIDNYKIQDSDTITTQVYLIFEDGSWKVDGGNFFTRLKALSESNPKTGDSFSYIGLCYILFFSFPVFLRSIGKIKRIGM